MSEIAFQNTTGGTDPPDPHTGRKAEPQQALQESAEISGRGRDMTLSKKDLASVEVVNRLPAYYRPEESAPFPNDMIGATIIQIGTPKEPQLLEGGGLVVDYLPQGSTEIRRVVLSLTELGASVDYIGPVATRSNQNELP